MNKHEVNMKTNHELSKLEKVDGWSENKSKVQR